MAKESDRIVWLHYNEPQADLAMKRERIRLCKFNMDMVTFTKTNRVILDLPDLNDDTQEWDEDKVIRPSDRHM